MQHWRALQQLAHDSYVNSFFYSFKKQDNALVGDDFMNQIQSIAAYVPYMTCPGNHEAAQ